MGETTTRFATSIPRSRKGWNMGGLAASAPGVSSATTRRTSSTNSGARSSRLSQVMALERVMTPKAKRVGWKFQKRRICSNHTSDTSAACCVFSTSSRREVSKRSRQAGTSPPSRKAWCSAMESSIASFVPLPMEKCAVALASPSSTTLPRVQRAQRIMGKRRHSERLVMSGCPCRSSANTPSRKRALSSSPMCPRPARAKVSGSVSSTQVERPGSYW